MHSGSLARSASWVYAPSRGIHPQRSCSAQPAVLKGRRYRRRGHKGGGLPPPEREGKATRTYTGAALERRQAWGKAWGAAVSQSVKQSIRNGE